MNPVCPRACPPAEVGAGVQPQDGVFYLECKAFHPNLHPPGPELGAMHDAIYPIVRIISGPCTTGLTLCQAEHRTGWVPAPMDTGTGVKQEGVENTGAMRMETMANSLLLSPPGITLALEVPTSCLQGKQTSHSSPGKPTHFAVLHLDRWPW